MKRSLLNMVQNIMSAMDSDEVSSITDTVESAQVAEVIQEVYEQMITNQIIPEFQEIIQLDTINLAIYPGSINYLVLPTTITHMDWFQYNRKQDGDTTDDLEFIHWLSPADFLNLVSRNRTDSADNIQVTDPSTGIQYWIVSNYGPRYWTSFDDENIALDSIDMGIDIIQVLGSKSIAYISRIPTWTVADSFIPDIDDNFFPYLLAESKATCFVNLKQTQNNKVEKQALDQRIRLQNHKFKTSDAQKDSTGSTGPDYGRRSTYGQAPNRSPRL